MKCTLRDGKILNETCEVNLTHHCNLACRGCSHLSPVLPRSYVDPSALVSSLNTLALHYRAEHLRLLGGEPLLHPELLNLLRMVRQTGISERIRIVTNGVLLNRMADTFWEMIDELHVSVYPGHRPTTLESQGWQDRAQANDVEITVKYFDRFRESYSETGTADRGLTRRIYSTCQIAHQWRCHTVEGGVFYKCPQSPLLSQLLRGNGAVADGVSLDHRADLRELLIAYLESPDPLRACQHCLGSVGRLFPHSEVNRRDWRRIQSESSERMVDYEYLQHLESVDANPDNGCARCDPGSGDIVSEGQKGN